MLTVGVVSCCAVLCRIASGGDGVVYTWDLRSQRCLHQQRDEGVVSCTSLALSPDGSYLATGDSMGVVNLYSRPAGLLAPLGAVGLGSGVQPATPSPLKTMMNLTTAVDSLSFSHDSQVLLMGSRLKRESLRLVHMPSLSVFANWPTTKSPLHYVHCAAFSPHSGFLGIGNAKGRVLLYRVHHYPSV
jgi:U3 small nucleolar RNA-associated protein 18